MSPLHVVAEVLASRRAGAYRQLTLSAPGVPERCRAGSFVALDAGEGRLARRALWVHRVREAGAHGATLDVVVEPAGPGTRWIAALPVGSRVPLTGPLGRPFSVPREPVCALLVGEGRWAAPLLPLAERLRERGCRTALVVGAADEAHLLSALEARRAVGSLTVVTADGSVGSHGRPADLLARLLAGAPTDERPDVVYAAAPPATLAAVARAAAEAGVWAQTALETPAPCGTGLCRGCPVPVVGDDGVRRVVRGCAEGPVLRADRVDWDVLEEAGWPA